MILGNVISIHALLAESDSRPKRLKSRLCVFLSTLSLRRATLATWKSDYVCGISIHALLAESDSSRGISRKELQNFYPRSPCGERQKGSGKSTTLTNFYPRSPCGERQQKCTKQWGTFAHMKQILWGLHLHADRQGCILPFLPLFFPYFLVRRNREFYDRLPLALSKQDSILIKIRVQPHMLDFAFVMVSQLIKAQAVRF